MTSVQQVIHLAKEMTTPTLGSVQAHKLSYIRNTLIDIGADFIENPVMGILVNPNKDKARTVIVNHFDLIQLFDTAISEQIFEQDNIVVGALDNSIVNAIVLFLLQEKLIPDNISILFSNYEETGFFGIHEFFNLGFHHDGNFYVNLDVTTQIKNESVAIEYDQWWPKIVDSIRETMSDMISCLLIHNERYEDDLSAILDQGGNGTSFCLATTGIIHSYKCATTKEYILDFMKALQLFCELPPPKEAVAS